jgi:hypothetical protein
MRAIVVTDEAAGTSGMKLVERPDPQTCATTRGPTDVRSARLPMNSSAGPTTLIVCWRPPLTHGEAL